MHTFLRTIGLLAMLLPAAAHAQLGTTITSVGGSLMTSYNGLTFTGGAPGIAAAVVLAIWSIVLPAATFLIIRAGISLVISQEDDKLSKAKRTIASTLIGIILIFVSQKLVASFVTIGVTTGFTTTGILSGGESVLRETIYGLMNWVLVMMLAVGALMIIVGAIRAIASFGKEEGVTKLRQTVSGVAIGMLLISLVPAIRATLGIARDVGTGASASAITQSDATSIIRAVTTIVGNGLLFLALLAVAIVIYAGIRMIVNAGNEEEFTKSRSLIIRAVIGLLIILLSYVAVQFVIRLVVPSTP